MKALNPITRMLLISAGVLDPVWHELFNYAPLDIANFTIKVAEALKIPHVELYREYMRLIVTTPPSDDKTKRIREIDSELVKILETIPKDDPFRLLTTSVRLGSYSEYLMGLKHRDMETVLAGVDVLKACHDLVTQHMDNPDVAALFANRDKEINLDQPEIPIENQWADDHDKFVDDLVSSKILCYWKKGTSTLRGNSIFVETLYNTKIREWLAREIHRNFELADSNGSTFVVKFSNGMVKAIHFKRDSLDMVVGNQEDIQMAEDIR